MEKTKKIRKLRVFATVGKAIAFTLNTLSTAFLWGWPALLISTGLIPFLIFTFPSDAVREYLFAPFLFLLFAPIAISSHRKIILKENFSLPYFKLFATPLYWRYSITSSLIYLLPFFTAINDHFLPPTDPDAFSLLEITLLLGVFILIFTSPVVITRFCISPSLIATGKQHWIVTAWRLTRKNTWRILAAYMLVNVGLITFIVAPLQATLEMVFSPGTWIYSTAMLLVQILNMLLLSLLNASKISFIFEELRHNMPELAPERVHERAPDTKPTVPKTLAPSRSRSIREHYEAQKRQKHRRK